MGMMNQVTGNGPVVIPSGDILEEKESWMEQPMSDVAENGAAYIIAMMDSFERKHPGIAELLALHDNVTRRYVAASSLYRDPVVRTSSSHCNGP